MYTDLGRPGDTFAVAGDRFVRLLCEININNMNIIKIMNCVPPKIKPYCLNV